MENEGTKRVLPSLADYPAANDNNLVIYDNTSMENYMAVLSHYLHSSGQLSENDKTELLSSILEFLKSKPDAEIGREKYSDEDLIEMVNEPVQSGLFSEFFHVPFPNPKEARFTFIDLFAGIGGIRLPFSEMNYKCVFSSEWDKHAQQTYLANFGEMPFGDITKPSTRHFIPEKFDLLLAGFPCQAFSIMGKRKGFEDTRGTLFFEVASILKKHRPKAFLLENVKQLVTHDKGRTFETILATLSELGYTYKWKILNAMDFGVPQRRERVIIVGFSDKEHTESFNFEFDHIPYNLENILEPDESIDPSLFASEMIVEKRRIRTEGKNVFYPSVWHENKSGNISVLDHACALRTGASYNYLLINGVRRPSSRELLRFQGFPDSYRIAVSHSEIRKQTGNSVAVPMIREIAKKIDRILKTEI